VLEHRDLDDPRLARRQAFGVELSFTVAQPPATAVAAQTSAASAATMSALRTFDLLVRMPVYTGSGRSVPRPRTSRRAARAQPRPTVAASGAPAR
jgi:hypothetical protein